jgi:hypothetical protein
MIYKALHRTFDQLDFSVSIDSFDTLTLKNTRLVTVGQNYTQEGLKYYLYSANYNDPEDILTEIITAYLNNQLEGHLDWLTELDEPYLNEASILLERSLKNKEMTNTVPNSGYWFNKKFNPFTNN